MSYDKSYDMIVNLGPVSQIFSSLLYWYRTEPNWIF